MKMHTAANNVKCELTILLFLLRKTPSPLPATPWASRVLSTLDWQPLEQPGGQVELPRWHPSGQSGTESRQSSDSSGSGDVQFILCLFVYLQKRRRENKTNKRSITCRLERDKRSSRE